MRDKSPAVRRLAQVSYRMGYEALGFRDTSRSLELRTMSASMGGLGLTEAATQRPSCSARRDLCSNAEAANPAVAPGAIPGISSVEATQRDTYAAAAGVS
jgi:hypothetical protein